jgi:hypothetical protein
VNGRDVREKDRTKARESKPNTNEEDLQLVAVSSRPSLQVHARS